jgi:putative peptidoglycan lipid II flippase
MQAFVVAFRLPEFMRKVSTSGVFTQIINPHISDGECSPELKTFISTILYVVAILLLLVTVILISYSQVWNDIYACGLVDRSIMLQMVEIMFITMIPFVLFSCIVGIVSAVLNSFKKYIITSLIPTILNIVMIGGIIISSHFQTPIYVVADSVLLAGLLQVILALYFLHKIIGRVNLDRNILLIRNSKASDFLKRLPRAFMGTAMLQIGTLVETFFATFLLSGSLAWLYYADRVNQFLYGILGTAIATVIIPYLISHKDNKQKFYNTVSWILKFTILIVAPAILGIAILSKQIVISLFYYGKFSLMDVDYTQLAILAYLLSLFCFVYIRVVISAMYVLDRTKTVFNVSLICLVFTIILDSLIVYYFENDTYAFAYLALVSSVVALINLCIQAVLLSDNDFSVLLDVFLPFKLIIKVIVSCVVMFLVIRLFNLDELHWLEMPMFDRFANLSMIISAGIASYLVSVEILGVRKALSYGKHKLSDIEDK